MAVAPLFTGRSDPLRRSCLSSAHDPYATWRRLAKPGAAVTFLETGLRWPAGSANVVLALRRRRVCKRPELSLSHDTLLHRVLRPSIGLLAGTRVSPDSLTALRLLTGLGAALCLATGSAWAMGTGAGLFLLSTLLDRADGELARQSGQFSRIGPGFDLASDCIATMAIFIGLGIGAASVLPLAVELQPAAGLLLGLSGAVSTVVLFVQLNAGDEAAGQDEISRRFDPDDMMLLVPLAIWCGGAGWILIACGVLTPLAAIFVSFERAMRRARIGKRASSPRRVKS